MNNFTLFENTFFKRFLALALFFAGATIYAQNTNNGVRSVNMDHAACVYYAAEFTEAVSIPRPQSLIDKMESGRVECSSFDVNYNGFSGPAQNAFQFAVDIWANSIGSEVPITVNATFTQLNPGVLGSAGADGFYRDGSADVEPNTFYPSALYEKITEAEVGGTGGNPSIDINANFSNQINWYFGLDANPPNNQFDFVSVVLHELCHGLGFAGFGRLVSGDNSMGTVRFTFPSIYDTYIENGSQVSILDFPDPSSALLDQMTSNNLFSNSVSSTAENGGVKPKTFTPSTFNPGSSYSHWDTATFPQSNINSLMTPSIAPGVANHNPGPITLGFFEDMGWDPCGGKLTVNEFDANSVEVSPNPFGSSISIRLTNNQNDDYRIDLIDINGRVILTENKSVTNNTITLSNLNKLDDALYFIKITNATNGASITKKVIKN